MSRALRPGRVTSESTKGRPRRPEGPIKEGLVTSRGGRLRPAFDVRSLARALGLAGALAAPLATLARPTSASPQAQAPRKGRVPTLYHKNRSFRIPFNVEPADRP